LLFLNLKMSQTTTSIRVGDRPISPVAQMRAGVYRGKGRVVVETVPIPEIGEGEVLFRVAACGICGTDIKKIQHGYVAPPQILGHELAGTVVKVGTGVKKFKPGDRVVSFHHVPCEACFYCERKLFSQCAGYKKTGLTAGFDPNGGGFAEFVRAMPWVVERGMIALPPDVTFEDATFVEPVNTCLKAVRKARVAPGESVLVIGQGPIGMLLMLLAKYEGAEVFTSDPMPGRRAASVRFGAKESFDPASVKLADEMRRRTSGRGADAVLVAVPNPSLVPEALAIARPGGRVLLFAHNDPVTQLDFPAAAVGVEEKEILGSYSASAEDQQESAALVFERRLPIREMISDRFPLERIAEALALAAKPADNTLKVVIVHE
jgi:L-iditol 2-dehydrogenase